MEGGGNFFLRLFVRLIFGESDDEDDDANNMSKRKAGGGGYNSPAETMMAAGRGTRLKILMTAAARVSN